MKSKSISKQTRRFASSSRWLGAIAAAALLTGPQLAHAVVADGIVSPGEYANMQSLFFFDQQKGTIVAEPGELYWQVDPATNSVYAAFVMPRTINDNTYGVNSIGWGTKTHTFGNLTGSDKGQFDFYNANGTKVLSFNLDYLTSASGKTPPPGETPVVAQDGKTYASLGVLGGDGGMIIGNAGSVLDWGTSLSYNFNVLGYGLTVDSPSAQGVPLLDANGNPVYQVDSKGKIITDKQGNPIPAIDYTQGYVNVDPNYAGWQFDVIYEVQVSLDAFGAAGFGLVDFPQAHNSPSKLGQNTLPQIPEPASALAGAALLAAAVGREFGRGRWASRRRRA